MADWYYVSKTREQAEVSEADIPRMISAGELKRSTLMWREGMLDWEPCELVLPNYFNESPTPSAGVGGLSQPDAGSGAPSLPRPGVPQLPPAGVPVAPTDGQSVAALVCGILAITTSYCYGFGILAAIPAVILGHLGLKSCRQNPHKQGRGMALAGLIMGYITIGLVLLMLLFFGFVMLVAVKGSSISVP